MHLFDIIGPIMIGPSSSHTAGAVRIGRVARGLLAGEPGRARIGLYGSFAETYRGHGTDRALVAGLLGMAVDDPRIRDSLRYARESALEYEFYTAELSDAHPNTAVIALESRDGRAKVNVRACSVGGGAIRVDELDGLKVSFTLKQHTLVFSHHDAPGVIARASGILSAAGMNIATMQVFRDRFGGRAAMVLELDALPEQATVDRLAALPEVERVILLKKQV